MIKLFKVKEAKQSSADNKRETQRRSTGEKHIEERLIKARIGAADGPGALSPRPLRTHNGVVLHHSNRKNGSVKFRNTVLTLTKHLI